MKRLRFWGTASICLLTLCLAINARAGVIDIPIGGSLSGFGPDNYRGQTFIALPGVAEDLTVYVGESNAIPGPVTYHVLITEIEIDTTGIIHPTNVLFESGPLVTNIGYAAYPPAVTVDLGGLSLTAGEKYAWILDAYVEIDANPPFNPGGPYPSALVGLNDIFTDNFPEIERISLNLGPFPTGTREEHFNSDWWPEYLDHAFTMNFSDAVIPVQIDIKPNRKADVNVINLKKDRNLKVAIVGDATFDALQVDTATVKFGPSEASPVRFKGQDYNRDGYSDLILTFKLNETGIACGDTAATLTGKTVPDPVITFQGTDTFTVEGCDMDRHGGTDRDHD